MSLSAFLQQYGTKHLERDRDHGRDEELLQRVPKALQELYLQLGTGKLRNGMFELIDPRSIEGSYGAFYGGDSGGRVPFLLNAFCEPISYKRLGGREVEISILHTYGPKIEVLAYDLADFFDRIMLTDDGLRQVINVPLFNSVSSRLPKLKAGESYGFDPMVLLESSPTAKADSSYFDVVNSADQLKLLYQRALDED